MAIEHFHLKKVRRSKGDSAVAGAAYRLAQKVLSERHGRTIDMSRKSDVRHTEIMAPANTPAWLIASPQVLWNEVERCEKRVDSVLAREAEFALPNELTFEQNLALAREIIQEQFVSRGMIANFAIHEKGEGDRANPHVHVLLTTRHVGPDGFSQWKERAWDDDELLLTARAGWSASTNRALATAGHEVRISHRSYRARGIELEPMPKIGRAPRHATADQRDVVQRNQARAVDVLARNAQRLLIKPEIALHYLADRHPTFTLAQIEAFVAKRATDADEAEAIVELALASAELVRLPMPDREGRARFTTRSALAREQDLLREGALLLRRGHAVEEELVTQAVEISPHPLNQDQRQAVTFLTSGSSLSILEGYAGTGKSSVAGTAKLAWEAQGYRVLGGALAGVAADALANDARIPSRTLHSWLRSWSLGRDLLTPRDVFVVDEFGMVGTAQAAQLLQHVREAGAKLVLIGDTRQLPAIDPGAPMRLLAHHFGSERLTTIVRQRHPWQRELTLAFADYDTHAALRTYEAHGHVTGHATTRDATEAMLSRWDRERRDHPADTALLLAFRRSDVKALNEGARARRRAAGELGPDVVLDTQDGPRAFAVGDRVRFTRPHLGLDVRNGQLGVLERMEDNDWVVRLDDGRHLVVDIETYQALDHGYAGTLHKGQGATVDRAYILASSHLDASGIYVAMSRHRLDARIHFSTEEFGDTDALFRQLSRVSYTPMAHELDVLRAERLVSAYEQDDSLFMGLPALARQKVLETLMQAGQREALSATAAFTTLEQVRAAEREHREASVGLIAAERALADYRRKHPAFGTLRAEHATLEAAERNARAQLERAEGVLTALRSDPALRQKASSLAEAHNRSVLRTRGATTRLRALHSDALRAQQLRALLRAENVRRGRLALRVATHCDDGREFVVERRDETQSLLFLRDAPGRPLIVAPASSCQGDARAVRFRWRAQERSAERQLSALEPVRRERPR